MDQEYYVAKTFFGLEPQLTEELEALGAEEITPLNRAVKFKATLWDLYHIAPSLRTAHAIVKELYEFEANNEHQLYKGIQDYDWSKLLHSRGNFRVDAVVSGEVFTHSKYAAQKSKDAVADQFMERFKERPNVKFQDPNLILHVLISGTKVRVGLNATGEPLFKRGYRAGTGAAPLNECLAAALLMKAGWKNEDTLYDPMCGSGTFSIEAAMIKRNQAPNKRRDWFAFMGWKDFNRPDYMKAIENLEGMEVSNSSTIIASDNDFNVLGKAKGNARRAQVYKDIQFEEKDMLHSSKTPVNKPGIVMLNPPYDVRMGNEDVETLYKEIGDSLKTNYQGCQSFIISSNEEALKHLELKPSSKEMVYNGGISCKFQKFELFSGSYKEFKQENS